MYVNASNSAPGKGAERSARASAVDSQQLSQQDFLRRAMAALGMTQKEFARRFRVSPRTLEKWLLPDDSKDHRRMPDMAWGYVEDVLKWEDKA